jgi:transcriptional regulator with XRE-family HTH domain
MLRVKPSSIREKGADSLKIRPVDCEEETMKHPVDVHVGKRIRHRRWMNGTTQQQLAEAVGIKFQQIQKYETGMNRVSASRLWDIANVLNVEISFFFEGISDEAPKTASTSDMPGDILTDKEALELLRSYYAIPENQRRRLFDLARVLSEAA